MFEWLEARGGRWSQPSWPLAWGRKLPDTDHGCLTCETAPACDILDYWIQATLCDNSVYDIELVFQNTLLFVEIYLLSHRHFKTKKMDVLCFFFCVFSPYSDNYNENNEDIFWMLLFPFVYYVLWFMLGPQFFILIPLQSWMRQMWSWHWWNNWYSA